MSPRFARHYGMILVLLAVPCPLGGQKPSAIPLVPAANWHLTDSKELDLSQLSRWGGDPAIDREYGVRTLEQRTYVLKNRKAEVIVEETPDPSFAYGLLTFYQTEAAIPVRGMPLTLMDSAGVSMSRGRFFIRLPRPQALDVTDSEFRALLVFIGGAPAATRRPHHLPMAMPEKNLVPGSEKYLLGLEAARRVLPTFRTDLIGFAHGAEVQIGAYRSGGQTLTMLAITYPTPQIARVRYGAMESFLGFNQDRGAESVFARRSGSFIFLVLGSSSSNQASSLMDQLQVTGHISWDERPPISKPFATEVLELIVANLLLILILVGFSLAGGILVFAGKRMVAKWFPQWSWANPDCDNLIRLDLR